MILSRCWYCKIPYASTYFFHFSVLQKGKNSYISTLQRCTSTAKLCFWEKIQGPQKRLFFSKTRAMISFSAHDSKLFDILTTLDIVVWTLLQRLISIGHRIISPTDVGWEGTERRSGTIFGSEISFFFHEKKSLLRIFFFSGFAEDIGFFFEKLVSLKSSY